MTLFISVNHIAIPSIIFAYIQISALFAFPVFSFLAWSSLGWHSVHYGACIATALFFGLFMLINYDDEFKEKAARRAHLMLSSHTKDVDHAFLHYDYRIFLFTRTFEFGLYSLPLSGISRLSISI